MLLSIFILFALLLIVFSIPAVQTAAGKFVTNKLNDKFGTDITVDKLGIKWNGDLNLKGILIKDHHEDTLVYAGSIATSVLSAKKVIDGNLELGDVGMTAVKFYLKIYEGEQNDNISIFSKKFATDTKSTKAPFFLTSDQIKIKNGVFRYTDENLDSSEVIWYSELNSSFENFRLEGSVVDTHIENLSFSAKRNYHIKKLKGEFHYDPDQIRLEGFDLETINSHLRGDMLLDTQEGMADFNNKVGITLTLMKSDFSTTDILPFYSGLSSNKNLSIQGSFKGTLNDFESKDVLISGLTKSKIEGDLRFRNIIDTENFIISTDQGKIRTSYFDLKELLPGPLGSLPQQFAKLGGVQLLGANSITKNSIKTKGQFLTNLGTIILDVQLLDPQDVNLASYSGNVKFQNFDIGTFINDNKVGTTTFDVNVNGKGFIQEYLDTQLSGSISHLEFGNYDYKNITIFGNLRTPVFNGELFIEDPNLNASIDGVIDVTRALNNYDFTATIARADLHRLNFVKDSTAILKGDLVMDMTGTGIEDAFGKIRFNNTNYQNGNDTYFFKDFTVNSSFDDKNVRTIAVNSPDIIDGAVSGKFEFEEVIPLFRNAIGSLYTNYQPEVLTEDQFMDFDFAINNKIIEVFVPELRLEPNTRVRGSVVANDSDFKLTFKSPGITAFGSMAEEIEVRVDNKNPLFNTYIAADSISTDFYTVSDFSLINVTLKDTLFMTSEFKGGSNNRDNFDLALYHTINEDGNSVLGFKKSNIQFKENDWLINKENSLTHNNIVFDNNFNDIIVNTLDLSYLDESISVKGVVRDSTYKDIQADFVKVDLSKLIDEKENFKVGGEINGKLAIIQKNSVYLPSSTMSIDQLVVNEELLGNLKLEVKGDSSLTKYTVNSSLVNNRNTSLNAQGTILVEDTPTIDLDVTLDNFDVGPFSKLGGDIITNIRGKIDGQAKVSGNYKNPNLDGALVIENGGLKIPYLNVDYSLGEAANIALSNQSFEFQTVFLEDIKYETAGILNGTISHQFFRDWSLDLDIVTGNMLVLDTEKDEDALYYGTAFISGDAQIKGPADELVIDVTAETEEGTIFNIPIDDAESIGDNSFIHFLSPEEKKARIKGEIIKTSEVKGLSLNFDLDVDQDALIEIVVDKTNTLRGRGAGYLLIEINTNGKFNMWGDFVVYDGIFNFRYGGLARKEFTVEPLGNIRWDGDPFKALIDVSAIYKAEANPAILLENPSINRKIDVDVVINLDGELVQPEITFDIEYPNTSSTVTSELNFRLSDRTARELNAISLVSQGTFLSETSISAAGAVNNFLEAGSSILNDILFNNDDGIVDLGIDLVQADRSPNQQSAGRVGFTLSTQIANRVLINGKVGVPTGGLSESIIVGDVEIDFLLNEDGSLRAKVFNRQSDVQFIGETEGYTQGAGLSYAVDFNSFKELMKKIFKGKNREVRKELQKASDNPEKITQDDITFKQ